MIPMIGHREEEPGDEKGVDVVHLTQSSAGYKRGDVVWLTGKGSKGKEEKFKGEVLSTLWKNNGEWVVVEVEYTDLGGKIHKAIVKPVRADKLERRSES